jgi:hypothetical protein
MTDIREPHLFQRIFFIFRGVALSSSPALYFHYASSILNGIRRNRFPVAAKIAFTTAGPVSATAASPSPCGASWLSINHVSSRGASGMRSTL